MKWNHLLSWAFLLVATGPLLAHPITDSAEMPYAGPVSMEDGGVGALDDLTLSEQIFPPQDGGLRYSTLISGEFNRDGVRTGLLPRGDEKRGPIGETESPKSFQPCAGHPEAVQEASGEF